MVAIELKRGKFKPAYLGQLEFYLACLDKYVKREDENEHQKDLKQEADDRPGCDFGFHMPSPPVKNLKETTSVSPFTSIRTALSL